MTPPVKRNDDELEENWVAEAVAASDDEDVVSAGSEDEFEEEEDLELATAKRSREERGDDKQSGDADGDDDGAVSKKQKTEGADKPKKQNEKGIHKMKTTELFNIVNAAYVKHRGGQLTTLELAEGIKESHIYNPGNLGKHNVESLERYVCHMFPAWKKDFHGKGVKGIKYDKSPLLIIVCPSAIRATELIKPLHKFKGCRLVKLFAKHMKVEEQAELLAKQFSAIAVGTPARIKKHLEMGSLSLEHTRYVMIDVQKDKKNMTVLDLKDTAKEVVDMLQYYVCKRLNEDKLKLVLF
ncbi:TPA: hypothetical protein N0F65_007125 [Lagenidium giganteum]|uniref:Protein CMS1 n=1 Tax=Lagenidium giganteum TaxID=4803 RepID=A0AAV2YR75_9STRA|nr:TPA: hypothetical protein N0F65_007125 [Lagenidium giganteum]